ncbi:hypothetical protein PF005_g28703 [Phytophthora fragariae]|uniref:Uncharacterized protein n=1 Tax=Phytophthora fragariae TaxID=53985 RepID=A0A6A3VIB3_9STRA|nr:hypothetical protein PF009_g30062 [Phytophthora fragariae]KAE8964098.1 hypothetical protein PF011_g28791 [Phytophthora fragariae]KAE9167329.1 hypothetical protein PF004_g28856 [Phytophthora fragariae]KAE9167620.1 hypothetical protein PF005_g28703 [Phytophthora fragariae]KAE9170249.1 hypothetical protein PF002_g30142 [Phytophthora fragariae]
MVWNSRRSSRTASASLSTGCSPTVTISSTFCTTTSAASPSKQCVMDPWRNPAT